MKTLIEKVEIPEHEAGNQDIWRLTRQTDLPSNLSMPAYDADNAFYSREDRMNQRTLESMGIHIHYAEDLDHD
jgi:hypothetical protein